LRSSLSPGESRGDFRLREFSKYNHESGAIETKMKSIKYKGHTIELDSHRLRSGQWVARATVSIREDDAVKTVPIFGRRRASFDTRREADAYALELARLWIEGKIWGANGNG
jgi:hypothetical protein